MSKQSNKSGWLKNYGLLIAMLAAIVAGCVVGFLFPATDESQGAKVLEPLGTVFINMMFCIVVPMVFSSIAGAVANMGSRKRAGKNLCGDGSHRRVHHVRADAHCAPGADPLAECPGRRAGGVRHDIPDDRQLFHRRGLRQPAEPQGHAAADRLLPAIRLRRESQRRQEHCGGQVAR